VSLFVDGKKAGEGRVEQTEPFCIWRRVGPLEGDGATTKIR
jgi:hypothetical protein